MMIEQNTNYAYKLKYMDNPTFDKVRDLSTKFYRELPQALQNELFDALNRGIDILDSEPQMTAYLFAFSKMHQAKLNYAFKQLPKEFLVQSEINIIDYGCGQALGTMCYADFLRENGYSQKVKTITLIEPSEICLKRAALHASVFFPNAEIKTVNKKFDDLTQDDIVCNEGTPTLHILSNVLDMLNFNLERFAELVKGCLKGYNQFVCVGPYFGKNDRSKRMDDFAKNLMEGVIYTVDLNSFEFDPNYSWTCMVRCFGVGDLDYSISDKTLSTEVTEEDIENGIIDEFGVIYSIDGKRLLIAHYCDFETYTIKKGVKVICDNAFQDCVSLRSTVIPNSVTSIGDGAFASCESLQSIFIPNSVTSIGNYAFEDCTSLQSIVIPESMTSIGDCAFKDCASLQSIVIPESVTSIGDLAFSDCKSLQSLVIPNSVKNIGGGAFAGCESLQSIAIPESVMSIGISPFEDSGINSIVCHSKFFKVDGKALYDQNKKHLIAFYSNDIRFVIPNGVTSIGNWAFASCESLQSIVIPNSVTSIGCGAFASCESLQSIVILNSVTSIGGGAFEYCNSLQQIIIPKGSMENFKQLIPEELWDKLYYLEKADVYAEDMDNDLPF